MDTVCSIKKYPLHILSVSALSWGVIDIAEDEAALIVLTERTNPFLESTGIRKLVVDFQDVEDLKAEGAFTAARADRIIDFIEALPATVTDLYICCSEGVSRSAGCAAALLLMSGRSDRDVWRNPFYRPNGLVFSLLCREAGIFMPKFSVWLRKAANASAFRTAQRRHSAGKYERWQILE